MLYPDPETHLQLARQRADELARQYRRAQKPDADGAPRRPERLALLLSMLRRTRLERRPACQAKPAAAAAAIGSSAPASRHLSRNSSDRAAGAGLRP